MPWSGHVNPVREQAGGIGPGAEPVGPSAVPRPGAGTHRVLAHSSRTLRSAVVRISLRRRRAPASGDGGGDDADRTPRGLGRATGRAPTPRAGPMRRFGAPFVHGGPTFFPAPSPYRLWRPRTHRGTAGPGHPPDPCGRRPLPLREADPPQ
ncbi:hypothetical protein RGQ21_75540 [Kitasatospora aureofaciens]|nr:hypothetical protein RGQ21_75540 [Kitasatospora aureofaciens]